MGQRLVGISPREIDMYINVREYIGDYSSFQHDNHNPVVWFKPLQCTEDSATESRTILQKITITEASHSLKGYFKMSGSQKLGHRNRKPEQEGSYDFQQQPHQGRVHIWTVYAQNYSLDQTTEDQLTNTKGPHQKTVQVLGGFCEGQCPDDLRLYYGFIRCQQWDKLSGRFMRFLYYIYYCL